MRLATAIAILTQVQPIVAQLVADPGPSVDFSVHTEDKKYSIQANDSKSNSLLGRARTRYTNRMKDSPVECDPKSSDADVGALSCESNKQCVPDKLSKRGGYCIEISPVDLPNIHKIENEPRLECDPMSPEADVGLLSCGFDSICVADPSAQMGGVCVKRVAMPEMARRLEQTEGASPGRAFTYCDKSSSYYGMLNCDCSGMDLNTGVGSFSCRYDYCFGAASECCSETCAAITMTYSSDGQGSYTDEICYTFETPYVQSFCFGRHTNKEEESTDCFGSFNGNDCNSCVAQSSGCTRFDCGNTGLGNDYFCVEDFYPPILTSCYAECSTCSICPGVTEQSAIVNEKAFMSFTNFTCGYVDYLGGLGFWGGSQNDTCIGIRDVAARDCCVAMPDGTVSSKPTLAPTKLDPVPAATTDPTIVSTSAPVESPTEMIMPTAGSDVSPAIPPTWLDFSSGSNNSPSETPGTTCGIRIQTSKCKELLRAHKGVIPCSCEDKCITFIDEKFEKCDAGTSIAGSGSIVAGCTFQMADQGDFSCFDWDEAAQSDSDPASRLFSSYSMLLMTLPFFLGLAFNI